jgi:chromosome segregation ATPase
MIMNEPYSEYRVRFIERQINTLGANIERLYDEQTEGLKALKQDIKHDIKQEIQQAYLYIGDTINTVIGEMHKIANPIAERVERIETRIERIEPRIEQIESRVEQIEPRVERIEPRIERIEPRIERIEATMATKDDISALKGDISRIEATQQRQEQLLQAILNRLPPKQ